MAYDYKQDFPLLRASFAFYNTEEDADRFVAAVSSLRERMGYGE